jgi:hypothetical protein
MKYCLKFKCGAKLPQTGYLDENPMTGQLLEDKGRLIVYGGRAEGGRPVIDGKKADCLFSCPCKRASGRREKRVFFEDSPKVTTMVTCRCEVSKA